MSLKNLNLGFSLIDKKTFNDNKSYLVEYLNQGKLGLILGAGASASLGLPGWQSLIFSLLRDNKIDFDESKTYSTDELKDYAHKIKKKIDNEQAYLYAICKNLYKDVNFDFSIAKKELLIAISSLIVGKNRGNINQVVTYNFDCILEWYVKLFGLKVDVVTEEKVLRESADITIYHIHGYLPHEIVEKKTNYHPIIFTKNEFADRAQNNPLDFWKTYQQNFHSTKIFLSIGLSLSSLIDDLCPIIRQTDRYLEFNKLLRDAPYGYAFISASEMSKFATEDEFNSKIHELIDHGIRPITMEISEIPINLLSISSDAVFKIK